MKLYLTIIILLIGHISYGQQKVDTIISKKLLDSLQAENYRLKEASKKVGYQYRVALHLNFIDTVKPTKDSVIISYRAKKGVLLKRTIQFYQKSNCLRYETEQFFNEKGLLEYSEFWNCDCRTQKDVAEDEIVIPKWLSQYERLVYDSIGRVTAKIIVYAGNMLEPRRYEYYYDTKGKVNVNSKRILENEFWN